ncbi:hypothetical protein BJ742DRAFT_658360, partial [Cladochytrium replicatum]
LTPEDIAILEQRKDYLIEHAGHQTQHARMALILLFGLIFSQLAIMAWKKHHARSYNIATVLGLWLIPAFLSLQAGNWKYIFVWICFTAANFYIIKLALERPLRSNTPKLVYNWYNWVYTISWGIGVFGYIVVVAVFFGGGVILGLSPETQGSIFQTGLVALFYGLYFGTLGRDIVDRLSDRMAQSLGYYARVGFPAKHLQSGVCAICGESTAVHISEGDDATKVHTLNCRHTYHEKCIRGWTIIGKKDCCPYCKEKVDLKQFSRNPWDTTQQLYLQLLDALRFLFVWNPAIFLALNGLFNMFGLK